MRAWLVTAGATGDITMRLTAGTMKRGVWGYKGLAFGGLSVTLSITGFSGAAVHAEEAPPPIGKLVDVGGYRLHIWCMGEESEVPAVVCLAGAGDFSFTWGLVLPRVAKFTRACAYDKAYCAWSDPGPTPRTMK